MSLVANLLERHTQRAPLVVGQAASSHQPQFDAAAGLHHPRHHRRFSTAVAKEAVAVAAAAAAAAATVVALHLAEAAAR